MEKQITDGNKAIAEFMGTPIRFFKEDEPTGLLNSDNEPDTVYYDCELAIINGMPYEQNQIKYNISWDWLMPVVEKIESLGYIFMIGKTESGITCGRSSGLKRPNVGSKSDSKLLSTYNTVVEFIQWYNNEKN